MRPDNKQPSFTALEFAKLPTPIIKIDITAIKWLVALADIHETEVGVFGFVDELGGNTYFIRDIFYPKHSEAHGTTCDISPGDETMMAEWLIAHNREDDVEKAKFWGHSHVNMGVEPSHQDETQSIERMNRTQSYFIRGIFNKKGLLSISFFDYVNKRRYDNLAWTTDEDASDQVIRNKINELKILNMPTVTSYNSTVTPYTNSFDSEYDSIDWATRFRQNQLNTSLPTTKKHKNNFSHIFAFSKKK